MAGPPRPMLSAPPTVVHVEPVTLTSPRADGSGAIVADVSVTEAPASMARRAAPNAPTTNDPELAHVELVPVMVTFPMEAASSAIVISRLRHQRIRSLPGRIREKGRGLDAAIF